MKLIPVFAMVYAAGLAHAAPVETTTPGMYYDAERGVLSVTVDVPIYIPPSRDGLPKVAAAMPSGARLEPLDYDWQPAQGVEFFEVKKVGDQVFIRSTPKKQREPIVIN